MHGAINYRTGENYLAAARASKQTSEANGAARRFTRIVRYYIVEARWEDMKDVVDGKKSEKIWKFDRVS